MDTTLLASLERHAFIHVLSTREQHIRRGKATSNICTNQAFVALLAGAAILARGEDGMRQACCTGHDNALTMARRLSSFEGVGLRFPKTPFWNELAVTIPEDADGVIEKARQQGIHIGTNISGRIPGSPNNVILISFSDRHGPEELTRLETFFASQFARRDQADDAPPPVPERMLRRGQVGLLTVRSDELLAYYEALDAQNVSPDAGPYPLGSCTMKYNPKINEWAAGLPGFALTHPEAPVADVQGNLHILFSLQQMFRDLTGLAAVTLQPVAGAQGELVALKMFRAYHAERGQGESRDIILIPRSAHGTNPATATMAGYSIIEIDADRTGKIDMAHVRLLIRAHGQRIAGIMITNPNTSGIFETSFKEIADLVHEAGGLVYMDGANMNAIAGWVDLGAMGVDAVHNNLHKTWSIPHGGGGPGAGMVAVSEKLAPYLPGRQVIRDETGAYRLTRPVLSIGSVHRHFGNFAHDVRAYAYLLALGPEGLRQMSAAAALAARYLYAKLSQAYPTLPPASSSDPIMHEFIITLAGDLFSNIEDAGVRRAEIIGLIGKLFLDFGLHSPTVAFPAHDGLMIEPTESYTVAELDRFADIVLAIHRLLLESPQVLTTTPRFTPLGKIDEAAANRQPKVSEKLTSLPEVYPNRLSPPNLATMTVDSIRQAIMAAHAAEGTEAALVD